MKIRINPFDKASIDQAIKQLKEYERDFEIKEKEFFRRLAEIGVTTARGIYSIADYDGVNDVTVALVKKSNGYDVVAAGQSVGFIEFGTGVNNPEWDNTDMDYTPPKHGTYGKGLGKNPNGWYYKPAGSEGVKEVRAVHTYGNPPAEAMKTARDQIVENVIRVAREVWR